ncbi:MAG: ABC transporter ATP-binding protein [Methanomassiliicoccaceae archaeon]|jgi:iron complex transport system ATP-binding protein|nr:ABC transporter ATP-binding protein [Methanomassiliicoccaceae archaeon]
MLTVENVCFGYGEKQVLEDISFAAGGKEIISVLGPNGVGKTTLLKCICNFLRPRAGSVRVDGDDVASISSNELAKRIAYVPQRSSASRTTVFDSVLIGRRPYIQWGVSGEDMQKTWDAIRSLGLQDLALRYADELSGGELQKVQIARAVVQEPKILILDEPTNNLDIANQHTTMHAIIDAVRSRGTCTIMTMHDINLAVHYSDRFIFMKDGRIFEFGGPDMITPGLIERVYGIKADVIHHKGVPFVIPHTIPDALLHHHHGNGRTEHPPANGAGISAIDFEKDTGLTKKEGQKKIE